jgi:hypothetical protein
MVDEIRHIFGGMTPEQGREILDMMEDTEVEAPPSEKSFRQVVDNLGGLAPILPPVQDVSDDN